MRQVEVPPAPEPAAVSSDATDVFRAIERAVSGVVTAEPITIRLAVGCLAAGGHLLVEDHPGLGKTTLAKSLARALGLGFRRLQCTADLLPADVTGASVLLAGLSEPVFRPGPVFTNVLMADELNRASPRAQSALLEAMEERHVTVDGVTHPLPRPFFVLATQNPYDAAGTSTLPHGQLDRFLVRVSIGYPSRADLETLLAAEDPAALASAMDPVSSADDLALLMGTATGVRMAPVVRGFVLDLLEAVHGHPAVAVGPSPRAARALVAVARALAVGSGRSYVIPDDVQESAAPVLGHRLVLHGGAQLAGNDAEAVVEEAVATVPVPVRPEPASR
jgi:MoxR-like ATPase